MTDDAKEPTTISYEMGHIPHEVRFTTKRPHVMSQDLPFKFNGVEVTMRVSSVAFSVEDGTYEVKAYRVYPPLEPRLVLESLAFYSNTH